MSPGVKRRRNSLHQYGAVLLLITDCSIEVTGTDCSVEVTGTDRSIEVTGTDCSIEVAGTDCSIEVTGTDCSIEVTGTDCTLKVADQAVVRLDLSSANHPILLESLGVPGEGRGW